MWVYVCKNILKTTIICTQHGYMHTRHTVMDNSAGHPSVCMYTQGNTLPHTAVCGCQAGCFLALVFVSAPRVYNEEWVVVCRGSDAAVGKQQG